LPSLLISLPSPKVAELRSSGWPEPKKSVAEEESASKKKSHAIAITAPPDMKTPTSAAAADKKEDGDAKKGDAKANAGNGQQPTGGSLTSDEINFLNENIGEDEEPPTDGSEFGDSASDSGMPPEVAAAFEEFMANQK